MRMIQGKLTLAFLVVILVCLLPTSLGAAIIIQKYQERDALDSLAAIGEPVAGLLATRRFAPQEALQAQQSVVGNFAAVPNETRVIIMDPGGVVQSDTSDKLTGRTWAVPMNRSETRNGLVRFMFSGRLRAPDNEELAVAGYRIERKGPFGGRLPPSRAGANAADYLAEGTSVLVVSPWKNASNAWGGLFQQLRTVVVVALSVAVILAFTLSRSLTRRLRALTTGAHVMAGGNYEEAVRLVPVPTRGGDEVDELAAAFGQMATSVARAQQAQRDLVANVSHELKTPLTSIQGFSQAMIDDTVTDPDETRELATIIRQESKRMQRLVEQMLELSRLESGTVPIAYVPLAVDDFIAQIGRRYTRLAEGHGLHVQYSASTRVTLMADAGRLEQVLVNLLDNAIRHTDVGGSVMLTAVAAPGSVDFTVRDTGTGIPEAEISRLFERFYQVDRARSEHGRHVGLGLAIVREIVDAHRGTIEVTSTLGQGTTVTVKIPMSTPSGARAEARQGMEGRIGERRTPDRRPVGIGGVGGR